MMSSAVTVNDVHCGYIIGHHQKIFEYIYRIYIIALPPTSPQTPSFLGGLPTSYGQHRLPRAVTALEKYQIINKNINVIKLIDYLMIVQCGYSNG